MGPLAMAFRQDGISEGFSLGKTEGKTEGFNKGKTEGFNKGKTEGFNKGKTEGFALGKTKGFAEGKAKVLVDLLETKFGSVPDKVGNVINEAEASQIDRWVKRVLYAPTLYEVFSPDEND